MDHPLHLQLDQCQRHLGHKVPDVVDSVLLLLHAGGVIFIVDFLSPVLLEDITFVMIWPSLMVQVREVAGELLAIVHFFHRLNLPLELLVDF